MADILMNVLSGVNKRLKDMGDGTVAEVVYNANGSAGTGGTGAANTTVATGAGQASRVVLVDPVSGNGSLVQAFHNADNQVLGATSYGLMTGGVDQLLNGSGTLDRKRAVAGDGMVATGLAADVPMLWNGTGYDRAPGSAAAGMKVTVANLPALGAQPTSGSVAVTIASDQTVPVSHPAVATSGSITALGGAVALTLNGANGAIVDLRGTFTATLGFFGTLDGVNWFALQAQVVGGVPNTYPQTSATTPSTWFVLCAGCSQIRVATLAFTSGLVAVTMRAAQGVPWVYSAPVGATNVAITNGANLVGDIGMQYRPSSAGAASVAAVMSPALPVAIAVKAAAGRLLGVMLQNSATSLRSVKFWNALTTGVTLGTTPALFEIDLPAGGSAFMGFEGGIGFSTALTFAVTGAKGLTDATAAGLAVNDISGSLIYA